MKKNVDTLVPGDRVLREDGTVAYTVIDAGTKIPVGVSFPLNYLNETDWAVWARVQWADGGIDFRLWDDKTLSVEVAEK